MVFCNFVTFPKDNVLSNVHTIPLELKLNTFSVTLSFQLNIAVPNHQHSVLLVNILLRSGISDC